MDANDFRLDYFQIYRLDNPVYLTARRLAGRTAEIQGQFDEEPVKRTLEIYRQFADRVMKNEEKLYNPHAHLNCYALRASPIKPVRRTVWVANQFGEEQVIQIREPIAVMVPARKRVKAANEWTPRTELDHYLVYQVVRAKTVDAVVKLSDQFGVRKTRVYHPIAFAVPVSKRRPEHESKIINPEAHLTIYLIDKSEDMDVVLDTADQFYSYRLRKLGLGHLLAVPSKKLDWKLG